MVSIRDRTTRVNRVRGCELKYRGSISRRRWLKRSEKSLSVPGQMVIGKTTPVEVKAAASDTRAKPLTLSGADPTLKTLAMRVTEDPTLTRPNARLEITATRAVGNVMSSKYAAVSRVRRRARLRPGLCN